MGLKSKFKKFIIKDSNVENPNETQQPSGVAVSAYKRKNTENDLVVPAVLLSDEIAADVGSKPTDSLKIEKKKIAKPSEVKAANITSEERAHFKVSNVRVASSKAAHKRKQNNNDEATKLIIEEQKKLAEEDKKISVISKISLVWTVLSTIYAIASTCLYIWRGWVSDAVSYVLVAVLALYVLVFIVLIVLTVRNPKKGKQNVKLYKKTLGIFKVIANIVYLVLTAISLAGLTHIGTGEVFRWIFFGISSLIAVIQLGLKVALLVLKVVRILIAKKFKVEVVKFIDGKKQKKNLRSKIEERKYME